ncbi:MAG: inner membrane CreD family protein [Bacteroidetes bacterium]|nr:inner membrane CreD family protein [Bacteroidota bacterium]
MCHFNYWINLPSIFLVEITNRKNSLFQYTLVGLALCLFYILLLSLSEHIDFNFAYLISASVIILMITFYSLAVFKMKNYRHCYY